MNPTLLIPFENYLSLNTTRIYVAPNERDLELAVDELSQ